MVDEIGKYKCFSLNFRAYRLLNIPLEISFAPICYHTCLTDGGSNDVTLMEEFLLGMYSNQALMLFPV